ncbi:MAG: Fe-S cluster assembly protein SufB, partial [Leptolinea sp.]|nr:Fe-S cluster assembly protein SufB [Leptolinea sp.]
MSDYRYGFSDEDVSVFSTRRGLDREIVEQISAIKGEPPWMLEFRLKALDHFQKRPMPSWGPDISGLDFDNIFYYVRPSEAEGRNWDDVPDTIKDTFEKLGIPEAERKFLAGVGAQYESEMVYHSIQENLEKIGVIFLSIEDGLRKHPEIFREYFGTVIPIEDNKFAALNSAVWSGGSFVYVPKGVKVDLPLQAYFRMNRANLGQFERSLIIADEGAQVHYVEGCTAPQYTTDSFHSGVIEIIVKKNARVRYTTIQNWSNNVYNLVTQRSVVHEGGTMEWVDANLGSKVTMKYPSCYLVGPGARGEILSMAFAGKGQQQDTGGKVVHLAPHTSSKITSKSISKDGGRASYRGLLKVHNGA